MGSWDRQPQLACQSSHTLFLCAAPRVSSQTHFPDTGDLPSVSALPLPPAPHGDSGYIIKRSESRAYGT